MFKVGDIVEPKKDAGDINSRYLLGYPSDYYKVKRIGIGNITVVCVNDGFEGLEYYVDEEKWQMDITYLRRLKLEKICSKLEI